ncbi:VG15 protein [Mycobacteroides abscessus]|uniref:VG15 protein n=1 Tax=Mycobacteroides abscessus TaxID=36809 RepID=UPI000C25F632|nr:hypothetical protein [Mycobacteroides abscessus]
MPTEAAEFQLLLTRLTVELGGEIADLLARIAGMQPVEQMAYITAAYPEVVTPYLAASNDLTQAWYEAQPVVVAPSAPAFETVAAPLLDVETLAISGRWSLTQGKPIEALQGSATRSVFDQSRRTISDNVEREPGARWARYASANACNFCKMLATRGAVYTSEASALGVTGRSVNLETSDRRAIAAGQMTRDEALARRSTFRSAREAGKRGRQVGDARVGALRGSQQYGDKYHDWCHCIAVAVRPGGSYEPPSYVEQWDKQYAAAVTATREAGQTKGKYGAIDFKAVLRQMDAQQREQTSTP